MNDVRIVPCELCAGSGWIVSLSSTLTRVRCAACMGAGGLEVEVQPVSLEEAARAQGDAWHERAGR